MCRAVMAERSGESANDASDTGKSSTQHEPKSSTYDAKKCRKKFGEQFSAQGGRQADTEAHSAEAGSGTESGSKAGPAGKSRSGSVGAGVVQAVQERVGGNCGTHPECARYALRMPLLPEIAPSSWSGARI
jgi:hypothetical protein